jgi:hypothetical protein
MELIEYDDDGILVRMTEDDEEDLLRAAGAAAVIVADRVESVHDDSSPLGRMLRTANRAANDLIARYKSFEEDYDQGTRIQYNDVLLLGMAASTASTYHDGARGEQMERAGEHIGAFARDLEDRLEDREPVPYRYE